MTVAIAAAPPAPQRLAAKCIAWILCAALCGLTWGQPVGSVAVASAALVPMLWATSGDRWTAGAAVLAFQLMASRGMPLSTGIFFADTAPSWFGWALWLAMGVANALPWLVFWRTGRAKAWGLIGALAITTLPPLGVIGWANPLTSAGSFFPGLGFAGLTLLCLAWVAVALRKRSAALAIVLVAAGANVANWGNGPSAIRWHGKDTHYGKLSTAVDAALSAYQRLMDVEDIATSMPADTTLVLPETILGQYTSATARMLSDTRIALKAKHSTVLVGAEAINDDGSRDNVLVSIGRSDSIIRQRVPIPIGMWRPWADDSVSMHLFDSGVTAIDGRRVAPLICYEQLLTFPVLVSMASGADLIVGVANAWWARGTSAPAIQAQALSSWARLFGVPVVHATNL
ncbi:hypothetical protein [Cupriavidus pauculus]|uniref:hypothetical protein n=1 Tax=Cupriavidus pauculus TaxID=82633 RepID=UPI00385790F5